MNFAQGAILNRLRPWEKIQDLSARFGLPFIPEFDLDFFRTLFGTELTEELARAEKELGRNQNGKNYSRRGRLRRLLGDPSGAAADFRRALDLEPACVDARVWLAELTLDRPESEAALAAACAVGSPSWARLYLGAARLLRKNRTGAVADLAAFCRAEPKSALGQILLARAKELQGNRRGAVGHYRQAARLAPGCAAPFLCLSRAETDPARARRACEGALDADPTYGLITLSKWKPGRSWGDYLAWLRKFAFAEPERAGWYYRQEDIHYAPFHLQEYADSRRLWKARPRAAWAAALVARGALRCPPEAGRLKAGREAIEWAIRRSSKQGWYRAWRGLAKIKAGKASDAVRDFDDAVRLQPYYHRAYPWRGALLRGLGRAEEALADLTRAVSVDDWYPFAVHERSLARRALGDWRGAASDMDRAFRLDDRYRWVFAVGREPGLKERARGLAQLDRAVKAAGSCASLWVWRGQLRAETGDLPGALRDLERSARLDPNHSLAHAWLGWALLESGQARAACGPLRRALDLEPGLWTAAGWLARALFESGRREDAVALLDRVLAAKPKTWWVLHAKAELFMRWGRPRRALEEIRRAVRAEGRHAEGYFLAARARAELGDLKGAERDIDRALMISPNLGRGYVLRGELRRRLGRPVEGLQDYRTALERFPFLFNLEERTRAEALLDGNA